MSDTVGRTPGRADATRRLSDALGRAAARIFWFGKPILGLLVIWELAAQFRVVPRQALPHVYTVAFTLWELAATGQLLTPTQLTLFRAVAALTIAAVVGVSLGIAMARFKAIDWFFDPLISVGFPIPKVTLVPVYLLWFGFGTLPTVMLAATSATFPVVIATSAGARDVDRELVWSVRSMGISKLATTWKVILPAALPQIFNGLQIAVFVSFVVVLVTEMISSGGGLGENLVLAVRFHRTPTALSYLAVAIALGVAADGVFRVLRARLLRWTE